jgi:ABC-type sugar transport system permease subunit
MVAIWGSAGFYTVIYMAGLTNIPKEYYEAAMIDGGNSWDRLVHITVPLLRPVTLLVTILALVSALQVFGEVYMLTGGGPYGSTRVLTYLLYQEGFTNFRFGTAAAIGVVMTLLIALLSFVQFRVFGERGAA